MTLAILAAGLGSRFGGNKQLAAIGPNGETIMDYSIYDAISAGFTKVVFIIRRELETTLRAHFDQNLTNKIAIDFAYQELQEPFPAIQKNINRQKPWGTAHAILAAKAQIDEPFAVINADDFYGNTTFHIIAQFLKEDCAPNYFSMAGFYAKNTLSDFGTVNRGICYLSDNQSLTKVIESKIQKKDATILAKNEMKDWHEITPETPVSMNFWGFHPSIFEELQTGFQSFLANYDGNEKSEYLLPEVVTKMMHEDKLTVAVLPTTAQWHGVTFREEVPMIKKAIQESIQAKEYPQKLW